jgi:hypothetical protein
VYVCANALTGIPSENPKTRASAVRRDMQRVAEEGRDGSALHNYVRIKRALDR